MIKVVTHDAKFHTDDVFAIAALSLAIGRENLQVVRTRDESLISQSDYAIDIGFKYDPENNRFDHHQPGGAGKRDNGIEYSSVGLIWKKFGTKISGSDSVAEEIDRAVIQAIDAIDNGINISRPLIDEVYSFDINNLVNLYRPTWTEESDWDKRFFQAVDWAISVITRVIEVCRAGQEAKGIVLESYHSADDKRLVVIDQKYSAGREIVMSVLSEFPEPVYAVLYRSEENSWQILAIRKSKGTFESRKPLPENWRAKRGEDLNQAMGVSDAIFCHRTGFMCLIKSKESALLLAEKALKT